jgi:hypothetical protein
VNVRTLADHRPPVRRVNGAGLTRLGWPHFWLLSGILGGMMGLVALVFFAAFISR